MKALNILRELLVIIRIWGLLRPACLPVFVRSSENHDTLAHVFRLLSHLAQNPQEPDDSLIGKLFAVNLPKLLRNKNPHKKILRGTGAVDSKLSWVEPKIWIFLGDVSEDLQSMMCLNIT